MLGDNADAVRESLIAYQATGDRVYRDDAESIMGYVEEFFWDPAGGFYGSQDADLFDSATHEIVMTGEEYFELSDKDRRALGVPHVDATFFVDANGKMIAAALGAAAVLDEPRYQEMALLALDRLWADGRGPDGLMWHSLRAESSGVLIGVPPAYLDDQSNFGLALLAAYSATGERDYLLRAEELADSVLAKLHDAEKGGFYDLPDDPGALGALAVRNKPCEENAAVSRFFTRLYRMTAEETYQDAAEGALKLCGATDYPYPDYALAADDFLSYPLTLAVVGKPGDRKMDNLLDAANRFYMPGKVVIPLDLSLGAPTLGEFAYPPDKTAIYACLDQRCSLPATNADELVERVDWLLDESG